MSTYLYAFVDAVVRENSEQHPDYAGKRMCLNFYKKGGDIVPILNVDKYLLGDKKELFVHTEHDRLPDYAADDIANYYKTWTDEEDKYNAELAAKELAEGDKIDKESVGYFADRLFAPRAPKVTETTLAALRTCQSWMEYVKIGFDEAIWNEDSQSCAEEGYIAETPYEEFVSEGDFSGIVSAVENLVYEYSDIDYDSVRIFYWFD